MSDEIENPLTNGKLVALGYDSRLYHQHEFARGHSRYVMSRGELVKFDECPARWLAGGEDEDDEDTEALTWGSLVDCSLLERERLAERFEVKPETYPHEDGSVRPWNGNSTWCKKWEAEHKGKTLVKAQKMRDVNFATARLMRDSGIKALLHCSKYQVYVTADYVDRQTGTVIPIKVLIDLVPHKDHEEFGKALGDFKTARDAGHEHWEKEIFKRSYHVQAALYIDAYVAATGEDRTEFRHAIQENVRPYQTARRILSIEFVNLGRAFYLRALRRYARCLETGVWPDYETDNAHQYRGWSFAEAHPWMAGK
jgi:hypothetical protein